MCSMRRQLLGKRPLKGRVILAGAVTGKLPKHWSLFTSGPGCLPTQSNTFRHYRRICKHAFSAIGALGIAMRAKYMHTTV